MKRIEETIAHIKSDLISDETILVNKEELTDLLFNNLKWHFALEVSNIGIWDYNHDYKKVLYSKESQKMLGISLKNNYNNNINVWNDRVHPDDREVYFQDFRDHLTKKTEIYENISRLKHVDGSYKWILDRGKIIEYTNDGEAKRVIGVHIDITKIKGIEKALNKSIEIMTTQNTKLKNFAHIAAHNLKEHAGNFESLLSFYDESNSPLEKAEIIEHIKVVSKSINSTINNLREIVNVDSSKNNKVHKLILKNFVEDTIKAYELEISHAEVSITNYIDKNISIQFNKAYLQSIIQNLLSNSLKYKHPDRKTIIIFNAIEDNDHVIFSIEDNGLGIDLEKFGNEIFGLYQTFHNNSNSEGVGLYLTKSQVEAYGGSISVKSIVDKGSTFIIKFLK